ncbi:hypothetical protein ACXWTF_12670 [Thiomicrolovo sp. ZZH C-3]
MHTFEWISVGGTLFSPIDDALQQQLFDAAFGPGDYRKSKRYDDLFTERMNLLSAGDYRPEEWDLIGVEYLQEPSTCACGKTGVRKLYRVQNRRTGHAVGVGGSCLQKHLGLGKDEDVFEYLAKDAAQTPYLWLGKKYDTHIFAALGFKRAFLYFEKRTQRNPAPAEDAARIREHLKHSFGRFDAPFWQRRLERGMRLLHFLRRPKTRKPDRVVRRPAQWLNGNGPRLSAPISKHKLPGYENGTYMTMKREIKVVDGIWHCSCGGTYTKWGTSGPKQLPWMVCDKCTEEFIVPDPDEEVPF